MRWLLIVLLVLVCVWVVPVVTQSPVFAGQGAPVLRPPVIIPAPGPRPVLPVPVLPVFVRPAPIQNVEFSDEAVGKAIEKGIKFLQSVQRPDGSWVPMEGGGGTHTVGPSALATYALLESGAGAQTPKMKMAIDWLATHETGFTYDLGLRCNVWLLADKQLKGRCKKQLRKDIDSLLAMNNNGGFSYCIPTARGVKSSADNSNSQYAVLGAWAAARDRSMEIGDGVWRAMLNHWLRAQNKDGGWPYSTDPTARTPQASTATMTCAGIASTLVCMDNLQSGDFLQCKTGGNNATRSVEGGLEWLEKNFNSGDVYPWQLYYYYGVERVGLASGMKYFGPTDWYKTLGKNLLGMQQADGSWVLQYGAGEPARVVGTGFALLFLIRGREPLLFNKLQFTSVVQKKVVGSDWNCRPRDLAHLCAWIGENFETTVNWQVINTRVPVADWHDAPILYISGSQRPDFKPEEIEKLRQYVYQGGTIFSCAQCPSESGVSEFGKGMREAYAKIFPGQELVALNSTHDIYSKKVGVDLQGRPKFYMLTNGVRPLAIHCDEDLPRSWQANQANSKKNDFEAASNLFMYVTDQGVLRSRASHTWPEEFKFVSPAGSLPASTPPQPVHRVQPVQPVQPNVPLQPSGTVKIVRLKWDGNWNPEPLALERFSRLFTRQTHIQLIVADPVDIADVARSGATIAILSGQGKFQAKPESLAALKAFSQNGGTVIVDAAGGDELFANTLAEVLRNLNDGQSLRTLTGGHAIYNVAGLPDGTLVMLSKGSPNIKNPIQYRRKSRFRLGDDDSRTFQLKAVLKGELHERAAIFYSREDLTNAGLVGYYSFPVDGYEPGVGLDGSAYRIMRNIVIYAMGDKGAEALKKLAHENDPPPPVNTPPAQSLPTTSNPA